ncbi:MAG: molybdopterin-binding protein [Desulfobacteraceae bacterium]|nr:MAG: molybdopterin-binding protein [Desulfobacteraceae bacterium]
MAFVCFEGKEKGMRTHKAKPHKDIYEDIWIPTQCRRCMAACGLLAHRVNGVVVRLEGNPDSSSGSRGGLCPKGLAGLQLLYDPNRLNVPMKRTNPEKGIGVDPEWKEISWEEAIDEISSRLKRVMDEDPSRILLQGGISVGATGMMSLHTMGGLNFLFATGKGGPVFYEDAGIHCGLAGHLANQIFHSGFVQMPDWKYCRYQLQFGTNAGHGHFWQYSNRLAAEAMERGMKLVVFDPVCNYAASRATEWIPLLPGTDGAVCLAMCNVIVNELGIYDAEYLKKKSDAPYLIGRDGRFVRDKATNKPMIWDSAAAKARPYDDVGIGDFALTGSYEVEGIPCRPSWEAHREQFRRFPVEKASEISGVPAATIHRIATEFAEAARIGETIEVGGREFPFRPVGTLHIRSAVCHKNATNTVHAIEMLPHILGAANVPGGNIVVSGECAGYPGTGLPHSEITRTSDGYVTNKGLAVLIHFPPEEPKFTSHKAMNDVFNVCHGTPLFGVSDNEEIWQKAGIDPSVDILLSIGRNPLMSGHNPLQVEEFFKRIPFIIDYDIFLNEFNEGFADIVLPDTCYLEYSDWGGIEHRNHNQSPVLEDPWCIHITQKVVEPMYSRRFFPEVMIEILDRMGLRAKLNAFMNMYLGLNEQERLNPDEKIIWEDLCDRVVTHNFGPEHNWEWFKKHGFVTWTKGPEEVYWKYLRDARVPLYWEFVIDAGEKAKKIMDGMGIELDWEHYSAVAQWIPIRPHLVNEPGYDFYCFNVCDGLHVATTTAEQPWLDEASRMNPYSYNIVMNRDAAGQKGLKDGDIVELTSDRGNSVRGQLKLRKAQHPQTVVITGRAGHWSHGMPIARGKGVGFQYLMDNKFSDCDPVTWHPEPCVRVKISKMK